jgi:ADP-ribose pyrophosphatase YjhB (NUDIX family)
MKEKKFKPKPGQTDFTDIRWAPVINCVVQYKDKILLVQRSESLRLYPGYWNGISGFLDDNKGLEEKVYEELKEEIGMKKGDVVSIILGTIFDQEEYQYKKTWIVHPVLVTVNTDKVKLDWEAKNFKWVKREGALKMKLLPGFDEVLNSF